MRNDDYRVRAQESTPRRIPAQPGETIFWSQKQNLKSFSHPFPGRRVACLPPLVLLFARLMAMVPGWTEGQTRPRLSKQRSSRYSTLGRQEGRQAVAFHAVLPEKLTVGGRSGRRGCRSCRLQPWETKRAPRRRIAALSARVGSLASRARKARLLLTGLAILDFWQKRRV
jgi:hypothetical protein